MHYTKKLRGLGACLAVVFVLLGAQAARCSVNFTFPAGGIFAGCDVASIAGKYPEGMVFLGNGQVLLSVNKVGIFTFTMPADLKTGCPATPPAATQLSNAHVRGMAMALDGNIYGNDNSGNIVQVYTNGAISLPLITGVGGLGMALDPLTGHIFVTVNPGATGGTPKVVEVSGLPNNPVKKDYVVLDVGGHEAKIADGLAWSCDGKYLLVADYDTTFSGQGNQVFRYARQTNTLSYISFPSGTAPDGVAFGAPGTVLSKYGYTNTNDGHVYQFDVTVPNPTPTAVAQNGQDGDFVAVDGQGNLLLTQPYLITALYWKQGHGSGGFVLPGGTVCQSLHCATEAAASTGCLFGDNANTVTALADGACSASSCGGCATVNLELTALITLLKDLNDGGCLNAALAGAEALQNTCPCNPDPTKCPQPCDPDQGCGSGVNRIDLDSRDPQVRRLRSP